MHEGRRRRCTRTTRTVALLGVVALAAQLTLSGCAASVSTPASTPSLTAESTETVEGNQGTANDADSQNVLEGSLGEPVLTETFAITVMQAAPTDLAETSKVLPERSKAVAVSVRMKNTSGADVPLNALPYSVYNTVLRVGTTDYPGSLVSNFANDTRDGVVRKDATLNLNFIYQFPQEADEASFVWAPAPTAPDYPTVVVPIPADALLLK